MSKSNPIANILFGAGVLCLISVFFAPIGIVLFILSAIVCWGQKDDEYQDFGGGGHDY